MKVWFWIKEFQVFETEVHTMIDLIGRRKKIWVKISSGKDFYEILIFFVVVLFLFIYIYIYIYFKF